MKRSSTLWPFLFFISFLMAVNAFFTSKAQALGTQSNTVLYKEDFSDYPTSLLARACCGFGYNVKMVYLPGITFSNLVDLNELSRGHRYGGSLLTEYNGIMYTCQGGFIDTGHVRDMIDWTAHVAQQLLTLLRKGGKLELPSDGCNETFAYIRPFPGKVTEDLVLALAQRIVFEYSTWHEIATWFGHATVPIYSEKHSAFSIEDLYSNLLGTYIGAQALRRETDWSTAVDSELIRTLVGLGGVSKEETIEAFDMVEGKTCWWDRENCTTPNDQMVLRRYVDYGESLSPWLTPEVTSGCQARPVDPISLEIPHKVRGIDLSSLYELYFELPDGELPIPRFGIALQGDLVSSRSFAEIIEVVKEQVQEIYGKNGISPDL